MKNSVQASLRAIVLVATAATALGQSATITGTVTDPDGGAVKDAILQARNAATKAVLSATSSPKGEYALSQLPPGAYDLSINMPCCQWGSFDRKSVTLRAGESLHLDIHLPWGPNLGTAADDPILLLNEFRDRAAVPTGPAPRTREGKPDLSGMNASPITRAFPYKFVQTPTLIVAIHESDTPGVRQIFLDGRGHPADLNPTWQGHSIGRWDRDTLVIDTTGYNDRGWLSLSGIPHTEKLHTVERIRRPDYGHIEVEITMEDPGAFTGPWKRTFTATRAPPDEEIIEFVCNENNRDAGHYTAK